MKQLTLDKQNAKLLGVCAGFAKYFGIDANIVRILFVLLVIATGVFPFVIGYVVAYFLLPDGDSVA